MIPIIAGMPVLLAAGIWDLRHRRVPDVLWLAGIIPACFSWIFFDWGWQVIIANLLIAGTGVYARLQGWWGMGDAKAITWLAFTTGPVFALAAASVAALIVPVKPFKAGGVPYVWLLALGSLPVLLTTALCAYYAPGVANSLLSMLPV